MRHDHQAPTEADLIQQLETARAEIDSLRHQLEHAHRMSTLGTLTAGIAHEINNVLTPGVAYGQLVRSNPDDPDMRQKALQKTLRSVDAAARIVQSMLGLASGATSDETEASLATCVEAALEYLPRDPKKDGTNIVVEVSHDHRAIIRPIALQQIVLNLVLNACKALRPGGGRITIESAEPQPGLVALAVSDNGPGIPHDRQQKIFQPFTQSESGKGGQGLGLTVSRMLAEEAGGRLELESEPGHGARFSVILPRIEAEATHRLAG